MAEYRLAKVAKEINRSATAIADFLNSKGFSVDARPTTKITEDMYQACLKEFSADRAAKEEADKLKANQPARPIPTREKVETVDTISAPETIAVSAPEPVVEVPVEKAKVVETLVIENTPDTVEVPVTEVVEEQPISGIKVVGKIDLTPKTKKKTIPKSKETKPSHPAFFMVR
jgi:translation initiation factor IF-2